MLKSCIYIVVILGVFGVTIGVMGEPTWLLSGCLLVGSAIIAAAIVSYRPGK